ncbi:MAG TPA: DUF397 domain-containing protein [Pseudonocardiaceae bacterium]|nr:DUF397 domain-containing protein [Pseudonocardiaceae bacterium]
MNHDQALTALTTATGWRTSSYSQGANNCVEVTTVLATATGWHKSSYSQGENNCLKVTTGRGGWVGVRDSKLGARSPLLAVTPSQWRALLSAAQAGDLGV